MRGQAARGGFTLAEMGVVIAIIGVLAALAIPRLNDFFVNQRVKAAARAAADAFQLARGEALRTGNNHIVFFGPPGTTDPGGTDFLDDGGNWVPMLILNDGPPAAANCKIEVGEPRVTVAAEPGLNWGVTFATSAAPRDGGSAPMASGATFADAGGNAVNWVLFRPDGIPVVFDGSGSSCGTIESTGSADAALYMTNGKRDYAVVLAPLGGVRVHAWRGGAWTQ